MVQITVFLSCLHRNKLLDLWSGSTGRFGPAPELSTAVTTPIRIFRMGFEEDEGVADAIAVGLDCQFTITLKNLLLLSI